MKAKVLRRVLPVLAVLLLAVGICLVPMLMASADVTVADKNNLAANKYDWLTDKVGSAQTTIDQNGLRMENFNIGGSCYAIYQSNKFSEFKYSMYAKLHLTRPSECGYDEGQYTHDYSNLYISFMINSEAPRAASTCPWNGNQAYFSVCFENLQGSPKTSLYLNESFVGHGEMRRVVAEDTANTNWNDDAYHWFEFTFENDVKIEYDRKGNPIEYEGKRFTYFMDGMEIFSYFQRDKDVFCQSINAKQDIPFSTTSGWLWYWTSSDFPVGALSSTTNCYVDIKKVQITSYDNDNTEPFEICDKPEFDIEVIPFTPAASYDTGEEIEVRMSNIFQYEGDDPLEYSVTCNGQSLGTIRNGYWIWTPEEAGSYDIDFRATAGEKSEITYATIRVNKATVPDGNPDDGNNTGNEKPEESKKGCKGSLAGTCVTGAVLAVLSAGLLLIRRRKQVQ